MKDTWHELLVDIDTEKKNAMRYVVPQQKTVATSAFLDVSLIAFVDGCPHLGLSNISLH